MGVLAAVIDTLAPTPRTTRRHRLGFHSHLPCTRLWMYTGEKKFCMYIYFISLTVISNLTSGCARTPVQSFEAVGEIKISPVEAHDQVLLGHGLPGARSGAALTLHQEAARRE